MSTSPTPAAAASAFTQWRKSASMGIKLFFLCALALIMSISAFFLDNLVDDRVSSEKSVFQDVGQRAGGAQSLLGPTLLVPYTRPSVTAGQPSLHGIYAVFPTHASVTAITHTEERKRSLFRVPVYQADTTFHASFDLTAKPNLFPDAALDWQNATLILGVTELRGLLSDATVTLGGHSFSLSPLPDMPAITLGQGENNTLTLGIVGAPAGDIAKLGATFDIDAAVRLSGSQSVSLLAYGRSTQFAVSGNWASPGFGGSEMPIDRQVSPSGFEAHWEVPFVARGVRADGDLGSISGLQNAAVSVNFVEVADPYQSISRSLKYITLFLGLVFLTYFIFEATSGRKAHPAQYVLVGIAQVIFYLLLLSLAERTGFDIAFAIAGGATVTLFAVNAGWIFRSRTQSVRAFAIFGLLYGLIYCLLRLEDNALLVGATTSFIAVAAAMYFTRKIDWYSGSGSPATVAAGATPAGARDSWLE